MLNTIYKITNNINNKVYIGKTSLTIEERFQQHKKDAFRERNEKRPLYEAMNKYGLENFSIEEIETNISDENINDKEQYYIKKYNSYIGFENSNGYNATLGGDSRKYKNYKVDDVIKKYQQCNNLKETGRTFDLDPSYVRRLLIANNIKLLSSEDLIILQNKIYGHPVVQLDINEDIVLNIFNSKANANRFLNKNPGNGTIGDACDARRGHHKAYGYRWYWLEDWEKQKKGMYHNDKYRKVGINEEQV